jgi:hypothetical protein
MKGLVFTMLSEMVETKFGYRVWDAAILNTDPQSNGVYVSTGTYADTELLGYVADLSKQTNIPASELVFSFGEYMLGKFKDIHPSFFEGHTARSFLKSVDSVIHVEVAKLHPDAVLPRFTYRDGEDGRLIMNYRSPRNLCALAEGLIAGTADIFDTAIDVAHPHCMLEGAETCVLELTFSEPNE